MERQLQSALSELYKKRYGSESLDSEPFFLISFKYKRAESVLTVNVKNNLVFLRILLNQQYNETQKYLKNTYVSNIYSSILCLNNINAVFFQRKPR